MSRRSSELICEICTPLLATTTTSWARAADQLSIRPNNRINKRVLLIALISRCVQPQLEAEPNLGCQHVRIWPQSAGVCTHVVTEPGSMKEMTLQFCVEIRVKVPPPGDDPVSGIIFGKRRVRSFDNVMAVISPQMKSLRNSITRHHKPSALIERDENQSRPKH